jgi:L-ascorbate metabolism protein UlaG (beta-lactamase superfamily)
MDTAQERQDEGVLRLPAALGPEPAGGSLQFIGTATVLIRYGGLTLLTDPNFLHRGEQVHLGWGLHATRLTDPAMELEQVPRPDLVVLSHLHGDHFDQEVERRLDRTIPIVTTRSAALALRRKGFQATRALRTWQSLHAEKGEARVRITATPGRHAPLPLHLLLPPVMGSVLEFESAPGQVGLRLYITGDTLLHRRLREVPRHFPELDLMLMHLGGTRVLGVLVTMDGRQGVRAMQLIAPKLTIPIHYNDYTVFKSPLSDFQEAVHDAGLDREVRYLSHGDILDLGLLQQDLAALRGQVPLSTLAPGEVHEFAVPRPR